MIDRNHDLPIIRQAKALNISRGSVYYKPRPVSAEDLALMRRIDELHLECPFAGSRMLRDFLNREGVEIGRRHVATLMKRMGMEAIYRRPNTSKPAPGNKIYPYLLRGLKVDRPNQVWAMDITYIPMARGFIYLAAVVDWFSRRVLSIACRSRWKRTSASRRWRKLWRNTADRRFSTPIRAASSPARFSPTFCSPTKSRSAWMARAHGATMSSSSASGNRSNTKRSTCTLTTASAWRAPRSADIWIFTIDCARIRALTGARRTRPTSIRRPSRRRHEFSAAGCWMRLRSGYRPPSVTPNTRRHRTNETRRNATYHSRETVQTTGASSAAFG